MFFPLNQKGSLHALLLITALVVAGLMVGGSVKTTQNFSNETQFVLGDDSSESGSSGSGSSSSGSGSSGSSSSESDDDDDSSGSSGSDSSASSGSGSSGSTTTQTPRSTSSTTKTTTSTGIRVESEADEDEKRTEIRFSEDEKIKTRIEEDRTRIDVYSGGVKVRYEIRDGRVIIKAETEDGEEVEDEELFKIEERLGRSDLKIATAGGKLLVARNQVGALASFPLQIDLNTNQLIASTSAGARVLTTLPDQAVQNMLASNIISRLGPPFIRQAVESGEVTSVSQLVALGERNGVAVYEINGLRDQLLLGFIPITTSATLFVSAETGQLLSQEQSLLANLVDLLSP